MMLELKKKHLITSLAAALLAMGASVALAQDNNEEATEEEAVELEPVS